MFQLAYKFQLCIPFAQLALYQLNHLGGRPPHSLAENQSEHFTEAQRQTPSECLYTHRIHIKCPLDCHYDQNLESNY